MESPAIISRLQWGARPYRGEPRGLGAVRQILVHHSGGPGAATRQEGARRILAMQQRDQGPECNCPDIRYHFLIDGGGHVYQGAPFMRGETLADVPQFVLSPHVRQVAAHKLGICLLGCFHHEERNCGDAPTAEALGALEALLWFLCCSYAVPPSDVLTHRDFEATTCPGERLYVEVARVRARLTRAAGE